MTLFYEDFETPDPGWFFTGGAGLDIGKGLAHRGANNAWVRATQGWNAINKFHDVFPNSHYTLAAWLRFSDSLTDGYFSVRAAPELNGDGPILTELKLVGPSPANAANGNYNKYLLEFDTQALKRILLYVGLWGKGTDAWVQIDGIELRTPTGLID